MKKKDIVNEAAAKIEKAVDKAIDEAAEKAKKASEPFIRKTTESLLCKYSPDEIRQKTEELTAAIQDKRKFQGEKKAMNKQMDSKIEESEASINRLSEELQSGKEHRSVECEWHMNTPRPGRKTLIRLDTLEQVRESDMLPADRQQEITDERDINNKPVEELTDDPNDGRDREDAGDEAEA